MSGFNDSLLCGGVDEISSDNKTCTSCAQKVDQQKDGASEYKFKAPSIDKVDINSTPSKGVFVFGGGDTGGQTSNEQKDTKSNTKNEIFQFGARSNSGTNSIDKIVEDVGKLGVSDDEGEDNLLFQDPPSGEECPICMLPMPHCCTGACNLNMVYYTCCGKVICGGCILASFKEMKKGSMKRCCPFCRIPNPKTDKELLKRLKNRMKLDDPYAYLYLGCFYRDGSAGLPQDRQKAIEIWKQAAELDSVDAHYDLGRAYIYGTEGVNRDLEKSYHHWKVAAIRGHEKARYALGLFEEDNSMKLAMKHYMIAAGAGYDEALKEVGKGYKTGLVTKDEYASTLRTHQLARDEMKSDQRTKASTFPLSIPSII